MEREKDKKIPLIKYKYKALGISLFFYINPYLMIERKWPFPLPRGLSLCRYNADDDNSNNNDADNMQCRNFLVAHAASDPCKYIQIIRIIIYIHLYIHTQVC